jgi:hypothetical protein
VPVHNARQFNLQFTGDFCLQGGAKLQDGMAPRSGALAQGIEAEIPEERIANAVRSEELERIARFFGAAAPKNAPGILKF